MPYVAKFKLLAESVLPDNTLAIIKRDLKPCLDLFYPSDTLPDLANRTFGSFLRLGFPALVVDLAEGEDEESDDSSRDDESIRLDLLLVVTDPDGAMVSRKLSKYARALRTILMTAPHGDYLAGIPTTDHMGFTLKLSRKYLPIGKGKDEAEAYGYMRPCEFRLTLQLSER